MSAWMAVTTFVAVGVVTTVYAVRSEMGWINPVSVYFGVWSVTLFWFAFGWLDLVPLHTTTLLLVVDTSLLFAAGATGAWLFMAGPTRAPAGRRIVDKRRLLRGHKIALAALVGYFALEMAAVLPMVEALTSTDAISSGAGLDVRRDLVEASLARAEAEFSGGAAIGSLLGYVLFLGSLSLFTAPLVLRLGQRVLGLLPLLLLVAHSIVTLQRFSFVYGLLLFAFGDRYSREIVEIQGAVPRYAVRLSPRSFMVGAVIVVLLAAALVVPIELRDPDSNLGDQIESVAYYSASGLAGLSLVLDFENKPPRGNGAYTLWGLTSIAHRFGFVGEPPPNRLRFQNIRENGVFASNVYTYLIYPLYDFGVVGLYAFPFFLGLVSSMTHFQILRKRRVGLIPLGALLMSSITMGFFGLSLVRDFRFLFVAGVGGLLLSHLFAPGRTHRVQTSPSPSTPTL